MRHDRLRPSFETLRKGAAPQDEVRVGGRNLHYFRQRDVYHFHARAIYQRFRMTARIPANPCVWRGCIAD
jgi:hypothetical protein